MDDVKKIKAIVDVSGLTNLPDLTDIYEVAYKVLEGLPKKFHVFTQHIIIRVENFADEKTLQSLNLGEKYDLLGLYRGVPIPMKNRAALVSVPDTIFLYRCALIRFSEDHHENLEKLIYHVMIHEIGHHFGFSDFDMAWIDNQPPL